MTLSKFCSILQDWCHQGYSLDNIIISFEDHHLKLKDVKIKKEAEENVIIELEDE